MSAPNIGIRQVMAHGPITRHFFDGFIGFHVRPPSRDAFGHRVGDWKGSRLFL
jgi:hypothetical protein